MRSRASRRWRWSPSSRTASTRPRRRRCGRRWRSRPRARRRTGSRSARGSTRPAPRATRRGCRSPRGRTTASSSTGSCPTAPAAGARPARSRPAATGRCSLRLQSGRHVLGVPVRLPADPAIPARAVAAESGERAFVPDRTLLQRERRTDVPGWLWGAASALVLALARRVPRRARLGARPGRAARPATGAGRVRSARRRRGGRPPACSAASALVPGARFACWRERRGGVGAAVRRALSGSAGSRRAPVVAAIVGLSPIIGVKPTSVAR